MKAQDLQITHIGQCQKNIESSGLSLIIHRPVSPSGSQAGESGPEVSYAQGRSNRRDAKETWMAMQRLIIRLFNV